MTSLTLRCILLFHFACLPQLLFSQNKKLARRTSLPAGFSGSQFLKGKQRWKSLPKFLISKQFESITQWEGNVWEAANEGRKPQFQRIWRLKK